MLQLPAALAEKVQELRKDFDAFNREIYRAALSKLTFREGVTEADAIEYYELMQDIYNGYFRSSTYATQDFDSLVAKHEEHLAKMLNIMLYGIALGERRREK